MREEEIKDIEKNEKILKKGIELSDYFSKPNTGGAIASRGFTYQDYCTLIELFRFVDDNTFRAISIETLDDFTIFIDNTEVLYQVKKMQFDVKIINGVLEKDIENKKQRFIFTSKDSAKYNGLFDKIKEYDESQKSSRTDSEKEIIKKKTKEIVEDKNIKNSEKYLLSTVRIYEDTNIDDILYSKFRKWLDLKDFYIFEKDNFLDKLRLFISDKKGNRGELKKEEFYEIVDKFKSDKSQILETDSLPSDQSRHITIELAPVDNNNFKIIILEESKEKEYLKVKFSDDNLYTRNQIVDIIDEFIDEHCEGVSSSDIFLVFVLPSNLMSENIDFWKLSDEDRTLGDDYTILLRGRERFRKEGVFGRKRRYSDWKIAWENCQEKHDKKICDVYHPVKCGKENLNTRRVKDTPFIILDYNPNEKNLKTLYQSHVSIMMWANNCKDKDKFLELIEKHKSKKLGEIHTKLYEFKPNETGLDANIMLLYDDPNKLPHDADAPQFEEPQ